MKKRIHLVLDNIRSAYNVGSIFRTADAAGITKIHICGITPDPNNPKVLKTALDSERAVDWEKSNDTISIVTQLKKEGFTIYSAEITDRSVDFHKVEYPDNTAIVLGNEIEGVDLRVLRESDKHIVIPMRGIKESLNVSVSAGIIMFEATKE